MYIKVFVTLMVTLCILGLLSGSILYFGLDPSYYPTLSLVMMSISFVLSFGSLLGLVLLLCKKIYRRGFIYPIDAFKSFRHGTLAAILIASFYMFHRFEVLTLATGILLVVIIFLFEIVLTKIEDT